MIPAELLSFLDMNSRTLLLKGSAGSGKTILAVELAKSFQLNNGDVFWVTSRHSDPVESLDLETLLPPERRRDATSHTGGPSSTTVEEGTEPSAADNPSRILLDLEKDIDQAKTLAILDSIDGLWDVPRPAEVSAFINTAKAMADRTGVRIVFIAETGGPHVADHLVDGVVQLQQEHREGALVRTCSLRKMRGTALPHPVYVFTLANGRFSTHVESPKDAPPERLRPPGRWGPDNRLSTGIQEWDLLLDGGFLPGSVHLVEFHDAAVADLGRVTIPFILNSLAVQRPVVYVGMPNESPDAMKALIESHSDPSSSKSFRFVEPSRLTRGIVPEPGPVLELERLAPLDRLRDQVAGSGPAISVLNLAGLGLHGEPTGIRSWLGAWCQKTRARGGVDFLLAGQGSAGSYSLLADDWWQLDRMLDAPILRGKIPRTENHIVHWRTHKGYPESILEPIH